MTRIFDKWMRGAGNQKRELHMHEHHFLLIEKFNKWHTAVQKKIISTFEFCWEMKRENEQEIHSFKIEAYFVKLEYAWPKKPISSIHYHYFQ